MLRRHDGRQIWALVRMVVGSVIGIVGFGTLSMGFVRLSGAVMGQGVLEILLGTFIAMGVLAPIRIGRTRPKAAPPRQP